MLAALELTRQAVISLPQTAEEIKGQFMRFSHLWTRPIAEALQVQAVFYMHFAACCNSESSVLLVHSDCQRCSC